ncbi:MAG: CPBP family intramembrane metalloprotease [Bacteroidetes bacterium]|nr:CPBP family intramembrane metalloprotease [Bacteroidota bacterium]
MNDDFTKPKMSYWGQFGILLGLVIVGAILTGIMQFAILLSMIKFKDLLSTMGNETQLMNLMSKPENFTKVVLMQALGTFIMMAIPAYFFVKIVNGKVESYIGFKTKINIVQVLLVIVIALVGLGLSGGLGEFTKVLPMSKSFRAMAERMEKTYETGVMMFVNMKTFGDYLFSMLMIAILPAVFEELLFRGALQNLFVKWFKQHHIAILFTAICFSLVHFSIMGFLSRMMLGMVLGYVYYYSKSIWLNMLMHFINNGIAVTAMYFAIKSGEDATKTINETYPLWLGGVTLIIMIGLLMVYKKVCDKKNLSTNQFHHPINNF